MAKVIRQKSPAADKLDLALKELAAKQAKAGWFESSKYQDGTPTAYVASIHEFGVADKNIPPRPFMRPAMQNHMNQYQAIAKRSAKAILNGDMTAADGMGLLGETARANIQLAIRQVVNPPLKPATVAARLRRYSDKKTIGLLQKPLIDTGYMLATVSYAVEDSD